MRYLHRRFPSVSFFVHAKSSVVLKLLFDLLAKLTKIKIYIVPGSFFLVFVSLSTVDDLFLVY